MKYLALILLTFYVFLFSCKKDSPLEYYNKEISFSLVTNSNEDKNRMCIGDLVSLSLANFEFRRFIKNESISDKYGINNEIFLFQILDKKYNSSETVKELFRRNIARSNVECYNKIEDFINDLEQDIGLVIKLPDMISCEDWDERTIVPFLYVRTNSFCNSSNTTDTSGTWGLHFSGINDFYFDNLRYFPLILRQTQDYVVLDEHQNLQNGIHLSNYFKLNSEFHYSNPTPYARFTTSKKKYDVFNWNLLIKSLLLANNMISTSNYNNDSCINSYYDCIEIEDRKLVLDSLIYHYQNINYLDYIYNTNLRYYGRTFLSDNVMPLLSRKLTSDESLNFRILIGSYRINQIFDVSNSISVSPIEVFYDNGSFHLPEFDFTSSVSSLRSLKMENILLAEKFDFGDDIGLSLRLLPMDNSLNVSYIEFDDVFYGHYSQIGWTKYYDLMYHNPLDPHGFHSIAFTCRK